MVSKIFPVLCFTIYLIPICAFMRSMRPAYLHIIIVALLTQGNNTNVIVCRILQKQCLLKTLFFFNVSFTRSVNIYRFVCVVFF